MALINCPECNKQISDKAVACPNCGYPLEIIQRKNHKTNSSYILILTSAYGCQLQVTKYVKDILNITLYEAKCLIDSIPKIIFNNINLEKANQIKKDLEFIGATCVIEEYDELKNENEIVKKYKNSILACPHCGSPNISIGERGFSLISGFFGSNKTTNRCGNCGHSWQPK